MSYAHRACSQLTAVSARRLVGRSSATVNSFHGSYTGCVRSYGVASRLVVVGQSPPSAIQRRSFGNTASVAARGLIGEENEEDVSKKDEAAHKEDVKAAIAETTKQQIRRPWQREGSDEPPVSDHRRDMNKTMTKGKLLTTPTRLLKLILPVPVDALHDEQGNSGEFRALGQNQDIQPLALLVHPQQPLSYLERLIQAELPPIVDKDGREKMPNVYFLAESAERDESGERKRNDSSHIATYSGLGHEGEAPPASREDWVRWSSSTEIGDFIRDAARGREFVIDIDGRSELRVGVPSFNDRTHYMRVRLRRISRNIDNLAQIKKECDELAHRGAHRLAKGGFVVMTGWWGTVYYLTFHTDLGWDVMEPVTYLAGLATIMGGYLWFLFISRDLSYQAALKITVSRRQAALYQARGFDPHKWESFVQDANDLRREIRKIAEEYDVEYDDAKDLGGEEIKEVLEKEEKKSRKNKDDDDDDDDDDMSEKKDKSKESSKK